MQLPMVRLLAWVIPVGFLTVTKVGAALDVMGDGFCAYRHLRRGMHQLGDMNYSSIMTFAGVPTTAGPTVESQWEGGNWVETEQEVWERTVYEWG